MMFNDLLIEIRIKIFCMADSCTLNKEYYNLTSEYRKKRLLRDVDIEELIKTYDLDGTVFIMNDKCINSYHKSGFSCSLNIINSEIITDSSKTKFIVKPTDDLIISVYTLCSIFKSRNISEEDNCKLCTKYIDSFLSCHNEVENVLFITMNVLNTYGTNGLRSIVDGIEIGNKIIKYNLCDIIAKHDELYELINLYY